MNRITSARVSRSAGGLRVAAALAFLVAAGCHSLEVTNPNSPDLTRALASGGDVQSLLGGAYNKWYHAMGEINPSVMVDVASDHYESCWGNWGMKLMGWEPRLYSMINSHTDASDNFRNDIEVPWYNNYGALVSANLVILAMKNGVAIPGPTDSSANPMILAAARFMQGAALSAIALNYDSGYAFDETTDPTKIVLVGRDSVQRAALAKLDIAISLAAGAGSWSIPESFLNQTGEAWTKTQLGQVANFWAARTIAYFPHNAAENTAANWGKVASYASKGTSSTAPFNVEIVGDGPSFPNGWWNDFMGISGAIFDWMRVDVRVECLLDPTLRCHRPNNTVDQKMPQTADYRFNGDDVVGHNCITSAGVVALHAADTTGQSTGWVGNAYGPQNCPAGGTGGADFVYLPVHGPTWAGFNPARGMYRFSNLAFTRYYAPGWDSPDQGVGKLPFGLAAENDLLWAEGLVRSGGAAATAAARINVSRVGRGHLPALTGAEGTAALLGYINYERAIELFAADPMVPWYDSRRGGPDIVPHYYAAVGDNDSVSTGWTPFGTGLQQYTIRLLPVPQQELSLLGVPPYTFGGPNQPEPPAPPARGSSVVRGSSSIFGTTPDGRVILGPGAYNKISDELMAQSRRLHFALTKM
jgi:hypothetical protein